MISVIFYPEATAELEEIFEYYEKQKSGLAGEFRREVEVAIQRIRDNPQSYAREGRHGVRYCPIRRFPYQLVYIADIDEIAWIVAIMHHRRRPRYWSKRIKKQ